ncbi:ExeA family protein [Aliikangiella sp. IMCC44359]|uniref:ExeA family protein n=1 Tax=Aliikangiella sp. IMCC44359 TaxID=3459125 RepID=UPI00403A81EF
MIKALLGITQEPFSRQVSSLLPQQQSMMDMIKVHASQGGFSVIVGEPGVGKSVLREHIEKLNQEREFVVASCTRTLHTYTQIIRQLAESFKIEPSEKQLEKELIQTAFHHARDRKTVFTVIDEAHLLDMSVLKKLRLLFDRFPKNHNLILLGQRDLFYFLSMTVNRDVKSRITYSQTLLPLNDNDLKGFIVNELAKVKLGANCYNEDATELICRSAQGNLRLCRNLCYASLLEAAREGKKIVSLTHVNNVLIQPHWRSHEELIKQQAQ